MRIIHHDVADYRKIRILSVINNTYFYSNCVINITPKTKYVDIGYTHNVKADYGPRGKH